MTASVRSDFEPRDRRFFQVLPSSDLDDRRIIHGCATVLFDLFRCGRNDGGWDKEGRGNAVLAKYRQRIRNDILEPIVEREMKEVVFDRPFAFKDFDNLANSDEFANALQVSDNGFELSTLVIKDVVAIKNAEAWRVRGSRNKAAHRQRAVPCNASYPL
jgi:hypothetical protein